MKERDLTLDLMKGLAIFWWYLDMCQESRMALTNSHYDHLYSACICHCSFSSVVTFPLASQNVYLILKDFS